MNGKKLVKWRMRRPGWESCRGKTVRAPNHASRAVEICCREEALPFRIAI
jgi:hypothetical protein